MCLNKGSNKERPVWCHSKLVLMFFLVYLNSWSSGGGASKVGVSSSGVNAELVEMRDGAAAHDEASKTGWDNGDVVDREDVVCQRTILELDMASNRYRRGNEQVHKAVCSTAISKSNAGNQGRRGKKRRRKDDRW
jgi:hypothetical protein